MHIHIYVNLHIFSCIYTHISHLMLYTCDIRLLIIVKGIYLCVSACGCGVCVCMHACESTCVCIHGYTLIHPYDHTRTNTRMSSEGDIIKLTISKKLSVSGGETARTAMHVTLTRQRKHDQCDDGNGGGGGGGGGRVQNFHRSGTAIEAAADAAAAAALLPLPPQIPRNPVGIRSGVHKKARAFLPTEIGGSLHQKQASTAPSQRFEGISTQPHAAEMTNVISRQEVEMCKMTAVTAAHESLTADSRAAAVQTPAAEVEENDTEKETTAIAASTHGRAFEMFCILHGDKVCVNEIDRERVWEHVCMLCEYVGKYIHVVATCMFVCMYVCLLVCLFVCMYVLSRL